VRERVARRMPALAATGVARYAKALASISMLTGKSYPERGRDGLRAHRDVPVHAALTRRAVATRGTEIAGRCLPMSPEILSGRRRAFLFIRRTTSWIAPIEASRAVRLPARVHQRHRRHRRAAGAAARPRRRHAAARARVRRAAARPRSAAAPPHRPMRGRASARRQRAAARAAARAEGRGALRAAARGAARRGRARRRARRPPARTPRAAPSRAAPGRQNARPARRAGARAPTRRRSARSRR